MPFNRGSHTLMKSTYLSPYEEEYNRQLFRLQKVMSRSKRISKLVARQVAMSQDLQGKFSNLSTSSGSDAFTKRLIMAQCALLCKQIMNLTSKIKREVTA